MTDQPPDSPPGSVALRHGEILARARETAVLPPPDARALTPDGAAALDAAQALARHAAAPATLRAYKADWTHFSRWCAAKGFVPVPAAPEVVGAYLASLAETHAPSTIRRRLAALGKMHRYNDLPWNAAHGAIQGPLQGLLRRHGRPPDKAAALSLAMLRQLLATCDRTARGRRDRALLLFGFAGALRRSELVVSQCRGRAGRRAWPAAAHPPRQDRPGRAGGRGRPAARQACRDLPAAGLRGLAGGGGTRRRAAVPQHQHARADRRGGAAPGRGAADPSASHPHGRADPEGSVRGSTG